MKNLIYIALIFLLGTACKNQKELIDEEKSIITSLLPGIIDSTCQDLRIYAFTPPMPKSIFDKNNKFVRLDSSNLKRDLIIYQKRIDSIKQDTSAIYLEFTPVLRDVGIRDKYDLATHFKNQDKREMQQQESITIDYKQIRTKRKFKLQIKSKVISKQPIFENYKNNFSGLFAISRIHFDKERKFGVLSATYMCGSRCGEGYTIFIKKVNNKWVIDKIRDTWIA